MTDRQGTDETISVCVLLGSGPRYAAKTSLFRFLLMADPFVGRRPSPGIPHLATCLVLGFFPCWGQGADGSPARVRIPLDGKWELSHVTGKTDGSAFTASGGSQPRLAISYVFANTDIHSSENPDEKGRDRFQLLQKGTWNLQDLSWGEITLEGDGSPFMVELTLIDAEGRTVTYQHFPLVVKGARTYGFTLDGPGRLIPGFDPAKVRQVLLVVDEGGEHRYQVNQGRFAITGIQFSNRDREKRITANLAEAAELAGQDAPLGAKIKSLRKALTSGGGTIADLDREAAEVKHQALFSGSRAKLPFVVCAGSPLVNVRPEFRHFLGRPAESVALEAAANEYESAKLVIVPQAAGVRGLAAAVLGDLIGPDRARLPAANIEVRRSGFVKTTPTIFTPVDFVGEVEDPLLPNGLIDVPTGRVQPVWFTVHVPEGTPPGVYQTRLRISGAGRVTELPLSLRVRGFTLPRTRTVSRQFYYWLPAVARWYGFREGKDACDYNRDGWGVPLEMVKAHLDFLLRYPIDIINITWPFNSNDGTPSWPLRVRSDGSLDFSLHDELLAFCRERGMRHFSAGDFGRQPGRIHEPAFRGQVTKVLTPYLAHLREKGWAEDAIVKVFDEPGTKEQYAQMLEECRLVRSLDPKIKTLAAVEQPDPGIKGLLDIFLFRPNNWSDAAAAEVRAQGTVPSWYWCSVPYFKPFPNYFLNYPATDPRLIEWLHFKYDCTYFLMWGINVWNNNFQPPGEPRWPDIPWNPNSYATFNGDGYFVYPWPDGSLVSSVRLEALRDGAEDLESFVLLRKAAAALEKDGREPAVVAAAKKLLTLEPVVQSVTSYRDDPAAIETIRRQTADLLDKLNPRKP